MTEESGTIVADRYELRDVLGQGSQGAVWSALDRETGQMVAVKMLVGPASLDRRFVQRLKREMGVMKALEGTCAVAALELCTSPRGTPCLVMELLEGTDFEVFLTEREAAGEAMRLDSLMELLSPIVQALECAHRVGIVHRDLKPANVFLQDTSAGPRVRLLDFGLARVNTAKPLTQVGTVIGSPAYMAPEVWLGQPDKTDARADVYSLTVLVFRALSGKVPFDAPTLPAQLTLVTTAERPSLRALRSDLPKSIDAWVSRGMAIEPQARFADVTVLWDALRLTSARRGLSLGLPKMPKPLLKAWKAARNAARRLSVSERPSEPAAPPETAAPRPQSAEEAPPEAAAPEPAAREAEPHGLPHLPPPPARRPDPEDDAKTLVRVPTEVVQAASRAAEKRRGDDDKTLIAVPKVHAEGERADAQKTRFDLPRVGASDAVAEEAPAALGSEKNASRKTPGEERPTAKKAVHKKTESKPAKKAPKKAPKKKAPSKKKAADSSVGRAKARKVDKKTAAKPKVKKASAGKSTGSKKASKRR